MKLASRNWNTRTPSESSSPHLLAVGSNLFLDFRVRRMNFSIDVEHTFFYCAHWLKVGISITVYL